MIRFLPVILIKSKIDDDERIFKFDDVLSLLVDSLFSNHVGYYGCLG